MPTVYVSQSATNGYAIGSDANNYSQAQNKSSPKLTLASALSAAVAGDTIKINDGTYTAATFHDITSGVSISPENAYAVTLKCAAGQAQVVRVGAAGETITIGAVIVDAESNSAASCIGINGTTARGVVLDGTRLINAGNARFAVESINSSQVLTFTAHDVVVTNASTAGGIYLLLGAAAAVSINGAQLDNSAGVGIASALRSAVYLNATAAATILIRRVSGTWKTGSGGVSGSFIRASGCRGIIEDNRGMRLTGGDTSGALIRVDNASGVQTDGILIRRNHGSQETTGGFLILVGADGASANDNKTNRCVISENDVSGSDAASLMHGIMIGNSLGGLISGNIVRKAAIPLLVKLCAEAVYVHNNDIIAPITSTSGCCRAKGSVNAIFSANRVQMASGYINPAVVVDRDPTLPTLSTGAIAVGNVAYSPVNVAKMVTVGGAADSSTAEFFYNDYSALSYTAAAFGYQASTYDSVSGWVASRESTARADSPAVADKRFFWTAYHGLALQACACLAPAAIGSVV